MSMIGYFQSLTDADLQAIIEQPKRFHSLSGAEELETPAPKNVLFLSNLFGGKPSSSPSTSASSWKPEQGAESFDVDKAWHGIHFLLTDTPWEGDGPLAFILQGGAEIEEDCGYGNVRGFTSAEVKEIAGALKEITPEKLYAKADQAEFVAQDIYPTIWDNEEKQECIGYVTHYFGELKQFIQKLADSNRAMLVYLA